MAIPSAENFYYPTLKFFEDGQIHSKKDVVEFNKEYFSLTEEDINQKTKKGSDYIHKKHSEFAVTDLFKAGLLLNPNYGEYIISKRGKLFLENNESMNRDFLMLFNSFRTYKNIESNKLKIFQIIKKINNTELGAGNTHESYVRLNKEVDGNIIFNGDNRKDFISKRNFKVHSLTYTYGREKRFNGLGDFYRENNLSAGDEVIFERKIINKKEYYFIDFLRCEDNIILQKFSKGFEVLSGDINKLQNKTYNNQKINIEFSHSDKKRKDSPTDTDFYNFYLNEYNQLDNYIQNDLIEIRIGKNINVILVNTCVVHEMEVNL